MYDLIGVRASQQLEAGVRDRLPVDMQGAVDFHGHLCPGLTIGYLAARIAMKRLGVTRGADEELIGIVETDACGIDAFQYLTGCTLGKGNLIFRDHGKQVFTLLRRLDGRGVRVALRGDALGPDPERTRLKARVTSGEADAEEKVRYRRGSIDRLFELLGLADDVFADISDVEVELPDKAGSFPTVTCSVCGEGVMEPRARVRDGKPCCLPCAIRYGRGWEINV
ncbi:MAG: FmdE family protein [Coriobacteriia bacterium]|nr:FmdE family protein [Coriobacteriia bacterium]